MSDVEPLPPVVDPPEHPMLDENVSHHAEAMTQYDAAVSPLAARLSTGMISATHADLAALLAAIRQGVSNAVSYLIHGPPPAPEGPPGESLDMLGEQRRAQREAAQGAQPEPVVAEVERTVPSPEGEAPVSPEAPPAEPEFSNF